MGRAKAGVICPPWNAKNATEAGVTATKCATCGTSLVISASSRAMVTTGEAEPVCVRCMEIATTPEGGEVPILEAPGQRQELMERMGLSAEEVDDLIEYVNGLPMEEAARKVREYHERQSGN
jgi:ribosomal protein S27E